MSKLIHPRIFRLAAAAVFFFLGLTCELSRVVVVAIGGTIDAMRVTILSSSSAIFLSCVFSLLEVWALRFLRAARYHLSLAELTDGGGRAALGGRGGILIPASSSYRRRVGCMLGISSNRGGSWEGTEHPATVDVSSVSKIITKESGLDRREGIWR